MSLSEQFITMSLSEQFNNMSLSEQFIQHYIEDTSGNDVDVNHVFTREAELLCEKLKLDEEGTTGFVLTKKQFEHLSNSFEKYAKQTSGLYKLQFHPKSGHVVHDTSGGASFDIYPTRGLSKDFKYFRWIFNGLFCRDWIKFYETIQYTNCQYIAIKQGNISNPPPGRNCDTLFCCYDPIEEQYYGLPTHMGGGRNYYEPSAKPYVIMSFDVVVDGFEDPMYIKSTNKY